MKKLIFADDHALFCQGLERLLMDSGQFEIVSKCTTGMEALAEIRRLRPEITLLDISMPDINGIEVLASLRGDGIETPVVILTIHDEPDWMHRAFHFGANGYLLKNDLFEELMLAISTVLDGKRYLSNRISQHQSIDGYNSPLSPREREVLQLISLGLTNRHISEQLEISLKTVDTHRTRLMQKLNLHTTAELARHAVKLGLV